MISLKQTQHLVLKLLYIESKVIMIILYFKYFQLFGKYPNISEYICYCSFIFFWLDDL